MWQFVTETWRYDLNLPKLATVLAVLAVLGIAVLIYAGKTKRRLLKTLWAIILVLVLIAFIASVAVDGYYWLDKWEGRVVEVYSNPDWSFRSGGRTILYYLKIKLDDLGPEIAVNISPDIYSQIRVGDYIVKEKGKYYPEIR